MWLLSCLALWAEAGSFGNVFPGLQPGLVWSGPLGLRDSLRRVAGICIKFIFREEEWHLTKAFRNPINWLPFANIFKVQLIPSCFPISRVWVKVPPVHVVGISATNMRDKPNGKRW
ncbi:hypothetical protein Cflav_PD6283 [Pedosphaera parvula Ellin514]|uniref:Uncharacterized protein n=1 Tax=Pedosphaera parvula (strain Ellin514) TaxID=320771 RepID=B9XD62_PEDPL|nr:hypothetical protein Cflav_PD6283 [Pedosphaera parvula Ellin514]